MDLLRRNDVDELLEQALALEPAARPEFVRRAAGTDETLLALVNTVLAEADPADGFLAPGGALGGALASDFASGEADVDGHGPVLARGAHVAGYEVLKLAGRGGMGEVYRARDMRLGRIVALKLLPDRFARDPRRLARLEREARVLAALNHPRVASIHGIAEEEDVRALVLEWVEGQTLAERLASGPVPRAEALRIALQIAEALEAAHQSGIVHRDLKPSNVVLTKAGAKVLDFGLARAVGPDEGGAADPLSASSQRDRLVLGTPAYMSPEQARGERVDHRADIWAFGCVLVELLTGRRVFPSREGVHAIAQRGCPDPAAPVVPPLPDDTPAAVRQLVERCLTWDPRRRLGWISDATIALEEALASGPPASGGPRRGPRLWRLWPVAAALSAGALGALAVAPLLRDPVPVPVTRLAVPMLDGDELVAGDLPTLALSRDGRHIVYRARRGAASQLFHRALDQVEPRPIAGSALAVAPFLSPDAGWVAFSRDDALVKVPVGGGTPVVICRTTGAVAGTWTADDQIVFGGESTSGLMQVPASGGTPVRVTSIDVGRGEISHGAPDVLEDRRLVAFTISSRSGTELAIAPLDGGERRLLGEGRQPRFVPPDHLAFVRDHALWTAGLDLRRLVLTGSPLRAGESVDVSAVSGFAHFDASRSGTLVYLPQRPPGTRNRRVSWVDATGREQPLPLQPMAYTRAALSPDGSRIALAAAGPETSDLWLYSFGRATLTRLTFDDPVDTAPVWTPDGRRVVFRSDHEPGGIYVVGADGAVSALRVTEAPAGTIQTPYDVTPDGRQVLFTAFRTYRDQGTGMAPLDGRGAITWLVDGPFAELRPRLSPDGRWMAYESDETGRFEVYVRPFPKILSARWQVSTAGGVSPVWSHDGRALLYYQEGAIMRVPLGGGTEFHAGTPVRLLRLDLHGDPLGPTFDVSPDGRRFLVVQPEEGKAAVGPLMLVDHWKDERNETGGR